MRDEWAAVVGGRDAENSGTEGQGVNVLKPGGLSAHTPEPALMRLRAVQRARNAIGSRARTLTNALAHRFGYVHEDEAL